MQSLPQHWSRLIVAVLGLLAPIAVANAMADPALAYETVEPSRIRLGESATIRVTSLDGYLENFQLPTVPGLKFETMGRFQGFEFVGGRNGGNKGQGQPPGNGQGQGQSPPPGQAQSQGPPPQGQGQSPPQGQSQPPDVQSDVQSGAPPSAAAPMEAARHDAPGQMSPEEARQLLDSAKSDEHHSLMVPSGPRDPDPDKPFKNW